MSTFTSQARLPSRTLAWLLVVLIHILVLFAWQHARVARPRVDSSGDDTQWIWVAPLKAPAPPLPRPALAPPRRAPAPATPLPAHHVPARSSAPVAIPAAMPSAAPEPAMTMVPADPFNKPERTASDIMAQAKRDVGKIDSELRRASPSQIHAPVSTPQTRLIAGLNDAKVQHWYDAAQIEEIPDQTGSGRRISKVKTAMGTYCVTYQSNNSALDGFEPNKGGPKVTNCPR